MSCKTYRSLPLDERSPEDRLVIELAKVPCILVFQKNEAEPIHSSLKSGADVRGAARSLSGLGGVTV